MKQNLLIVFAKAPIPGRVKTRLVPPLTPGQAAAVHAASLRDVVAQAVTAAAHSWIMYDDAPGAAAYFAETFAAIDRHAQSGEDLGERLADAFTQAFERGMDTVAVIGSDSPTLPLVMLVEAMDAAETHDVVLGPAFDGGYYLVAVRRSAWLAAQAMFRDVAWSTDSVLRQTLERLTPTALDVHLLPPWYDIDRPDDLAMAALHAEPSSEIRQALDALPAAARP